MGPFFGDVKYKIGCETFTPNKSELNYGNTKCIYKLVGILKLNKNLIIVGFQGDTNAYRGNVKKKPKKLQRFAQPQFLIHIISSLAKPLIAHPKF